MSEGDALLTRERVEAAVEEREIKLGRKTGEVGDEVNNWKRYWDEMSGDELDAGKVKEAREEEMVAVRTHKLYDKAPVQESWDRTGIGPINSRWIDINKGDSIHPDYRSRWVAQEI